MRQHMILRRFSFVTLHTSILLCHVSFESSPPLGNSVRINRKRNATEIVPTLSKQQSDLTQVRERAGHELRCSVELLLLVTRWNASDEKYEALRAAIGFEPRPSDRLVSND